MASFKSKCEEYFGSSDFYEILKIEKAATEKEIKKAYHKLSLLVHPDRVGEAHKETATEKFKVLGRIHSILQDSDKRKIYDDYGEFDEESDDACFNWMEYWRSMFKKIDLNDIKKHEEEYIGSETELRDIKKAYVGSKGDMDHILEMVPFSNCDSEPRIMEIVRKMIDDGEVEEYNGFFNEKKYKRERRRRFWAEEAEEVSQINMEDLEKEMEENMKKRASNFSSFLSNLEDKYAPKKKAKKSITSGEEKPKRNTRKAK